MVILRPRGANKDIDQAARQSREERKGMAGQIDIDSIFSRLDEAGNGYLSKEEIERIGSGTSTLIDEANVIDLYERLGKGLGKEKVSRY